ncbi:hypothetical protein [Flavobacterium ustbae]|uniref:hypothetical protein n=1 Tax=Flavobacterium ustbae TaxID=2488790 RepID=UPI000F7AD9D9|nr:hypothetical protein [Flavobacterium ustbae]
MRFNIKIILFLYLSVTVAYSQTKQHSPKTVLAIETYVFLKGQSAALKAISNQFPTLRSDVSAVEKRSESSFGRAAFNIEQFLQTELESSQYKLLQSEIDLLLKQQLKNPIEKEKYAKDFLKLADERLHIMTDTLLYKGIMAFKYHDAPHQEITDGHHDVFSKANHQKAGENEFKIPIPKSWVAEEAEIPETIQQFTSFNGKGLEKIILMIIDLPDESASLILNEKSIKEMIPPQSKLIRSETAIIDDKPGMMIEVEESINTPTTTMKIRMLQFMCIHEQKLYCLQGSIGPVTAERNLAVHIKKYEPLFRLIASKTEIGY